MARTKRTKTMPKDKLYKGQYFAAAPTQAKATAEAAKAQRQGDNLVYTPPKKSSDAALLRSRIIGMATRRPAITAKRPRIGR